MPSPFPGMDPFLETNPIFQELHTQMLAEMQPALQPQLRPKYVARLERHLSEGSVWNAPQGTVSLERKEPAARAAEELGVEEWNLRNQPGIAFCLQDGPRWPVPGIDLLGPKNRQWAA